nr:MAG TPA: protein of unknown function (DUF5320) [Caudoviricetes sp.]
MDKRMKKKKGLQNEVEILKSEMAVLKGELNTLSQALKRHEGACSENIEQTNKEFEAIRQDMKRSKKSFFKR